MALHCTVNGDPCRLDSPLPISELLEQRHLAGKLVAVERNGEIVPRSRHASVLIDDGDHLEIVVAVGGG